MPEPSLLQSATSARWSAAHAKAILTFLAVFSIRSDTLWACQRFMVPAAAMTDPAWDVLLERCDVYQALVEELEDRLSAAGERRLAFVARLRAAVDFCCPDDMTPDAKRLFDSILSMAS